MRIRLAVLFALLGVICVALPLHIAMTGVCFLALAAVLTALHLLRGHRRERLWRAVLIALSCVCAAAVIGGTGYVIASGRSDVPDAADAPEFVVVLGAQIHGGGAGGGKMWGGDLPSDLGRQCLDLHFHGVQNSYF